jgi:hypothetical protein
MDDHALLLPWFLEWWQVLRRMNNRHSSSDEWFKRKRRGMVVLMSSGNSLDTKPYRTACLAALVMLSRTNHIQLTANRSSSSVSPHGQPCVWFPGSCRGAKRQPLPI